MAWHEPNFRVGVCGLGTTGPQWLYFRVAPTNAMNGVCAVTPSAETEQGKRTNRKRRARACEHHTYTQQRQGQSAKTSTRPTTDRSTAPNPPTPKCFFSSSSR